MVEELNRLKEELSQKKPLKTTVDEVENFRLEYLSKKGKIQYFLDGLRDVPKEEKPMAGKLVNEVRTMAEAMWREAKTELESISGNTPDLDVTLPGRRPHKGTFHPIMQTLDRALEIFGKMGFAVAEANEIEDDAHNFGMLNFAEDHPARDMQDTFFVKDNLRSDVLLRTHTSSVQIRLMNSHTPPIRAIMPGRVYRNEAVSARSLAEFHQIEGLYVDVNVTFADLKSTIISFAKEMYGSNSKFKFRPSYFPFTEPSAECDITCYLCKGEGCRICKHSGWLEICGAGMIHPNVLRDCGLDPEIYSGFAFGFGIERVTLLSTGIDDIRYLYENDIRVLSQF